MTYPLTVWRRVVMVLGVRLAGPCGGLLRRAALVGVGTGSGPLGHLVSAVERVGRVEVTGGVVTLARVVDPTVAVRVRTLHRLVRSTRDFGR